MRLRKFLETKLKGRMPKLITNTYDGRIPKEEKLKRIVEAIINAAAHRDYSIYGSKIRLHLFSDRLEIFSPGSIPNTMIIGSLPETNFLLLFLPSAG